MEGVRKGKSIGKDTFKKDFVGKGKAERKSLRNESLQNIFGSNLKSITPTHPISHSALSS